MKRQLKRVAPLLKREVRLRIAGVDEAGRGPLAGPVVAAACILPDGCVFEGLRDSKALSKRERERLYREITGREGVVYGVARVEAEVIDRVNILRATLQAMREAVGMLREKPDCVVVDGNRVPEGIEVPCRAIVKGDTFCEAIMAAAVLAKVTRDRVMEEYGKTWPEYGFERHVGYPTKRHYRALEEWGPCPIHRRSFRLGVAV